MSMFRPTGRFRRAFAAVIPVLEPGRAAAILQATGLDWFGCGLAALAGGLLLGMGGCASPGPPRSPSLRLPEPVSDLSARREGDVVELRFTVPSRSTDKLPLRAAALDGVLCRAVEQHACVSVAGFSGRTAVATAGPGGGRNVVTWRDPLPPDLASGTRRLLSYRVEFFSRSGRSAGRSDAAYAAGGLAPQVVEGLRAEGSRLGVILRWQPLNGQESKRQGEVLLEREELTGSPQSAPQPRRASAARAGAAAKTVWLQANATSRLATPGGAGDSGTAEAAETLDATAQPGTRYRYIAWRSLRVSLGGRVLELRSAPSRPVEFTLREIYPPPPPTGLSAAGFFAASGEPPGAAAGYAVDLIWQPVDAAGLVAGFAGYNVYRAKLEAGSRTRLNSAPLALPGFRDSGADPAESYRYFVTAVDGQGNESGAATVEVGPAQPPPEAQRPSGH